MILDKSSQEFRKKFLLAFTYELIKRSNVAAIAKLENILKLKLKEELESKGNNINNLKLEEINFRDKIISDIKLKEGEISFQEFETPSEKMRFKPLSQFSKLPSRKVLRIPSQKLPQHLEYLRPTPTNIHVDLGKLNPLIRDINVASIECAGAGEKIIVNGTMGTKPTGIILEKLEIESIVDTFSKAARIPASEEGVFRVALGGMTISALISGSTGTKFIIRKIRGF